MSEERPSLTMVLKNLARILATPYRAGTFVTITDVRNIALKLDIPVAVKEDRRRVIEEFLLAAVDYGRLPEALAMLRGVVESRKARLEGLVEEYPGSRGLVEEYIEASVNAIRAIEEAEEVYRRFYAGGEGGQG